MSTFKEKIKDMLLAMKPIEILRERINIASVQMISGTPKRAFEANEEFNTALDELCELAARADRQPPEEEPTVEIDALVVKAKSNWCAFSHRHGMDSNQLAAIDMLAALARKAHPAPVPVERGEETT